MCANISTLNPNIELSFLFPLAFHESVPDQFKGADRQSLPAYSAIAERRRPDHSILLVLLQSVSIHDESDSNNDNIDLVMLAKCTYMILSM